MFKTIKQKLSRTAPAGGKKEDKQWLEQNRRLVALLNERKVEEALAVGQEMMEYVDGKYRKDSREKATTYSNAGMAFLLNREYGLAEECFQQALAMRKRLFGDTHNEVAVILLNLAQLYRMQAQDIMMANKVETQA